MARPIKTLYFAKPVLVKPVHGHRFEPGLLVDHGRRLAHWRRLHHHVTWDRHLLRGWRVGDRVRHRRIVRLQNWLGALVRVCCHMRALVDTAASVALFQAR